MSTTSSTIKRLYADMAELLQDPLWRASAMPLEDNILEWHANICGPDGSAFAETPFHITLTFNNYPTQPPTVRLCTKIFHANAFGQKLCLDMLEEGLWAISTYANQPYTGWSSAYSVSSILRQLQAFLFDREDQVLFAYNAGEARKYHCPKCNHRGTAPWPSFDTAALLQNTIVGAPHAVLAANRDLQRLAEKLKEQSIAVETSTTATVVKNKTSNGQKKKLQQRKRPQQANVKNVVPKGFVIKEDPAASAEEATQQDSYIDQLVQQTIQKEKLKLEAAQKKKTKKKTKVISTSVVQVTPAEQSPSTLVPPVNQLPHVKAEVAYSGPSLSDMPYDVLLSIIQDVQWTDLNNLTCVNKQLSTLTQESHVWKTFCLKYCGNTPDVVKKMSNMTWSANETWKDLFMKSRNFVKNQLRCFHLKVSFEDDLLGIPFNVKHGEGGNRWIAEISSPLDVISHQAFAIEKVRKSCWKEPFEYWLPLFINKEHSQRALPWLIKYIPGMLRKTMFYATDIVTILPKLMSTMVVEVMSEKKHASFKALEGYCWFHRWFLEFATTNRDVRQTVDMYITNFVKSEQFRTKKETPSLGEWICLLSVSDRYNWTNVSAAYINENFDRNVKWLVQKHPELALRGLDAETRCELTFKGTLVSLRLLMFHVFFLDFVKPKNLSLGQIKDSYDAFYGMISHAQKEQFQKEVFAIMAVSTWEDFFSYIKLKKIPERTQLGAILEGSVANSLKKGYHKLIKRPGASHIAYIT